MNRTKSHPGVRRLIAAAALLAACSGALALADYPSRTIKIVVPFPPGGAPDTLTRVLADKLTAKWDRPVIVENRAGATGNIGAELVARAQPDGYTLMSAPPPPLAINQHLFPKLGYDPSAFVAVTVLAAIPNVLVVTPDLPVSDVQELIALAKANPGKLNYGSTGNGGTPHLSAELLKTMAGIDLVHVPYKSTPLAFADMFGGRIELTFANLLDAAPHIRSGKLRALAVGSASRVPGLPDVPALSERLPGFLSTTWFALAAPPATPSEIVAKLSSTVSEALAMPDVVAKLRELSAVPVGGTPTEAAAFIRAESERWRQVIIAAKIKPE